MKQLGRFRIFAGHYQFVLCDAGADPLHDPPPWPRGAAAAEYVASSSAPLVVSKATLNGIVVVVELSDTAPSDLSAQRHLNIPLDVPSGKLLVTSLDGLDDPKSVDILPGACDCHVLSYNLGVDPMSTEGRDHQMRGPWGGFNERGA